MFSLISVGCKTRNELLHTGQSHQIFDREGERLFKRWKSDPALAVNTLTNSLSQEIGSVAEWNVEAVSTLVVSDMVLTGKFMLGIT